MADRFEVNEVVLVGDREYVVWGFRDRPWGRVVLVSRVRRTLDEGCLPHEVPIDRLRKRG